MGGLASASFPDLSLLFLLTSEGRCCCRPSCPEDPNGKSTSSPKVTRKPSHAAAALSLPLLGHAIQRSPSPAASVAILIPEPVPWTPGGPRATAGPRLCGGQSSGSPGHASRSACGLGISRPRLRRRSMQQREPPSHL